MIWPKIITSIDHMTGEETRELTQTPEEFVEQLHQLGECILVTNRGCAECFYTPGYHIPKQAQEQRKADPYTIPECLCVTGARRLGSSVPAFVLCYGFYYTHWHENSYLLAAKEADLISFFDITGLPGLRESGLHLIGPYW